MWETRTLTLQLCNPKQTRNPVNHSESVCATNQRVPHISPFFCEMWETRTLTLQLCDPKQTRNRVNHSKSVSATNQRVPHISLFFARCGKRGPRLPSSPSPSRVEGNQPNPLFIFEQRISPSNKPQPIVLLFANT
jgi:hypothetical protein